LNQSTQRAVASSTSSMVCQGFAGLISPVLCRSLMVWASALSEAADRADRGLDAASARRSVNRIEYILSLYQYGGQHL
jgi:hypothetical protein